jgi:hypothetical protein
VVERREKQTGNWTEMAFYCGKILLARKIHGQPDGKNFFWYAKPEK